MESTSIKEKVYKAVREALIEKDDEIIHEAETTEINDKNESISVSFAEKYVAKGGGFLFCEKSKELIQGVIELFKNNDLATILCLNDDLSEVLDACNIKHIRTASKDEKIDFIVAQADALVAHSGSIVVSFSSEFENIVVYSGAKIVLFAGTDQIVKRYTDISKLVNSREHAAEYPYIHLIETPSTKSKLEFPVQTYLFLRHVQ